MIRLTGSRDQIRARLEAEHAAGELVMFSPPVPAGQGKVAVVVQLRRATKGEPEPVDTARWITPYRVAAVVVTVAALAGVVVFVAYYWATILGALAVIVIVGGWLRSRTGTGHCSGPDTGH